MTAAFGLKCPVCHAAAPLSSSAELDRRCSLKVTWSVGPAGLVCRNQGTRQLVRENQLAAARREKEAEEVTVE